MISAVERQALRAVKNFGPGLFSRRLGPTAEAVLAAFRGMPLPAGAKAERVCDARQQAALARARQDLGQLVGAPWTDLSDIERATKLAEALRG